MLADRGINCPKYGRVFIIPFRCPMENCLYWILIFGYPQGIFMGANVGKNYKTGSNIQSEKEYSVSKNYPVTLNNATYMLAHLSSMYYL